MTARSRELPATDIEILEAFDHATISYALLVAHDRGLPAGDAKHRCRQLAEGGYLERVSNETVYRITSRGHCALEHTTP